jgi:hypothetical protein
MKKYLNTLTKDGFHTRLDCIRLFSLIIGGFFLASIGLPLLTLWICGYWK